MARVRVLSEGQRIPGRAVTLAAQDLAARLPRMVLEAAPGCRDTGRMASTVGDGPGRVRPSGSSAPSVPASPLRGSTGGARRAMTGSMSANANGKRRIRVHLWIDRSASMAYSSELAMAPKLDRAIVLGLALAEGFVEAGERVGLMGALPPRASRRIAERFFGSSRRSPRDERCRHAGGHGARSPG